MLMAVTTHSLLIEELSSLSLTTLVRFLFCTGALKM
jgi:hypothetical protein